MKDSGIEWIGEIPEDWEITSVKSKYRLVTGFTPDTENPNYYDDNGYVWVNISDLSNDRYIVDSKKKISDLAIKECKGNLIKKGSLLYSFKLSVGQVSFAGNDLYTNEAIASFIEDESINLNFFYYMSSFAIIQNANENIYGAKLLNQQLIKNAKIVFPPLNEQQKIANFLDKKVAEIDHILEKTRESIEEYKMYKQSIITEAVTKGLDPNVPMKDSGIEWIGEIPEDWETALLGKVSSIQTGNTPSMQGNENYYEDGTLLWVKPDNLNAFTPIYDTKERINGIGHEKARVVKPNTPLICCIGSIGKFGFSKEEVAYNQQINAVDFYENAINWKYGLYYLSTQEEQHWYYSTGNVVQILNTQNQKKIAVPIPPLYHQQKIANFLDKKVAEIDHIISKKEQLINNLESYKKSLIYEVVTGKKEVI